MLHAVYNRSNSDISSMLHTKLYNIEILYASDTRNCNWYMNTPILITKCKTISNNEKNVIYTQ